VVPSALGLLEDALNKILGCWRTRIPKTNHLQMRDAHRRQRPFENLEGRRADAPRTDKTRETGAGQFSIGFPIPAGKFLVVRPLGLHLANLLFSELRIRVLPLCVGSSSVRRFLVFAFQILAAEAVERPLRTFSPSYLRPR
jgi:hypothetical protein